MKMKMKMMTMNGIDERRKKKKEANNGASHSPTMCMKSETNEKKKYIEEKKKESLCRLEIKSTVKHLFFFSVSFARLRSFSLHLLLRFD